MKGNSYSFEYLNENEFRKKEKTLKKYNMLAFKKLTFEFYNDLRNGTFPGELVATNKKTNTKDYELKLPTDATFTKVHGDIILHYTVYFDSKVVLLKTLTPEELLTEGHMSELNTYKGVMISNSHSDKDMFKVTLLNMLDR